MEKRQNEEYHIMGQLGELIGRIGSETPDKGEIIPSEGVIVVDSIEEFMLSNNAVHLKDLDMKLMRHQAVSDSDGCSVYDTHSV